MKNYDFQFENKLVLLTCLIISIILLVTFFFNLIIEIGFMQNIIILCSAFLYFIFYLIGIRYRKYGIIKVSMVLYSFLLINALWYFNYASKGPILAIFVMYLCFLVFVFDWRHLIFFVPMVFLNVILLFYIEYKNPELIASYSNELYRITDVYFGTMMSLIIIFGLTMYAKRNYIRQYLNAKSSDELKSAFLDNLSHEIRTPLNAISGFSEIIATGDYSREEVRRFKEMIFSSSRHLVKFINEILDLSLIESNQMEIHEEQFNLDDLFKKLIKDIEFLKRHHKHEEIELIYKPGETNISMISDKEKIRDLVLILMDNAFKFTKKGSITYGFEIVDKQCRFFIQDTGIGIKPENMERIFERFVKIEDKQDELYRGIGQGLYLSKKIIQLLGGEIWVESNKDIGSRFSFTIPLKS